MESPENNEMIDSAANQDKALCPNCLAANDPRDYFCCKCATPMSSHAAIDPIASIWARGDTWRKAASRPTRPITLVGMWLLFGVPLLLLLYYVFLMGSMEDFVSLDSFIAFGVLTAIIVLYVAILLKTTRNYYRQKKSEKIQPHALEDVSQPHQ